MARVFFFIFHALSFELNFVFDRRFPLILFGILILSSVLKYLLIFYVIYFIQCCTKFLVKISASTLKEAT